MITFHRKGTLITAQVESGLKVERSVYSFLLEAGSENLAELLMEQFRRESVHKRSDVRDQSFEDGYSQGQKDYINEMRQRTRRRNAKKKK